MPDKVEEMLDRWNIACQDEVVPNYKARDEDAFEVSPLPSWFILHGVPTLRDGCVSPLVNPEEYSCHAPLFGS